MNPKGEGESCGSYFTVKEMRIMRARTKAKWLCSLSNNRKRWKIPS